AILAASASSAATISSTSSSGSSARRRSYSAASSATVRRNGGADARGRGPGTYVAAGPEGPSGPQDARHLGQVRTPSDQSSNERPLPHSAQRAGASAGPFWSLDLGLWSGDASTSRPRAVVWRRRCLRYATCIAWALRSAGWVLAWGNWAWRLAWECWAPA